MKQWISIVIPLLLTAPAAASPPVHWGNEVWTCGTSIFETVIGDGDITISRITGAVTLTPQDHASSRWDVVSGEAHLRQRQSLVALSYQAPAIRMQTTAPSAAQPANNEVDPALFAVNPKTIGLHPIFIPIDFAFNPPVLIPGGRLTLRIDTEGTGPLTVDKNCSNTETHMTIQ